MCALTSAHITEHPPGQSLVNPEEGAGHRRLCFFFVEQCRKGDAWQMKTNFHGGVVCGIQPVRPEPNWGSKPAVLTSSSHQPLWLGSLVLLVCVSGREGGKAPLTLLGGLISRAVKGFEVHQACLVPLDHQDLPGFR